MQDRPTFVASQVECDGTLPTVREGDRQVDAAAVGPDPLCHQAPVRITLGAFDADDVGPPVGEQRTGDGNEDPLRELDDANAFERTIVRVDHVSRLGLPRAVRG